jgi:hypothetical protein
MQRFIFFRPPDHILEAAKIELNLNLIFHVSFFFPFGFFHEIYLYFYTIVEANFWNKL